MKLFLTSINIIILFFFVQNANANSFLIKYNISTSGIKLGQVNWSLEINDNKYLSKIYLKNSGLFSPLYKFEGKYESSGILEDNNYEAKNYKQFWKTKKKEKVVEMSFNNYLVNLSQKPEEEELARLDIYNLFKFFDPITSFINILNGKEEARTIDGRRVYVMKKTKSENLKHINVEIKEYRNIWADHKRNDLDKIEFILGDEGILPDSINIFFKDRIFKLKKY